MEMEKCWFVMLITAIPAQNLFHVFTYAIQNIFFYLFLKVKFKCYKKLLNSFRFLWICFLMHVIYFKCFSCFSCYSYCAFPCYLLSKVFHDIDWVWVNRREVENLVTHALLCCILHHFYENKGLLSVLKVSDNGNFSAFVKPSSQ